MHSKIVCKYVLCLVLHGLKYMGGGGRSPILAPYDSVPEKGKYKIAVMSLMMITLGYIKKNETKMCRLHIFMKYTYL